MRIRHAAGEITWALVALKAPQTAKSRLRSLLSASQRRELFFALARKVFAALQFTPGIARVLVVTSSAEVARFARGLDVEVIPQGEEQGTAAAFQHALVTLQTAPYWRDGDSPGPDRLLMIAGDLPLISCAALADLLQQFDGRSGVCIVPDRLRVGTNALLCSPPDAIAPCFGADSFAQHCGAARAARVPLIVHESAALALDIDGVDDLALLGSQLFRSGVAHRAENLDVADLLRRLGTQHS